MCLCGPAVFRAGSPPRSAGSAQPGVWGAVSGESSRWGGEAAPESGGGRAPAGGAGREAPGLQDLIPAVLSLRPLGPRQGSHKEKHFAPAEAEQAMETDKGTAR